MEHPLAIPAPATPTPVRAGRPFAIWPTIGLVVLAVVGPILATIGLGIALGVLEALGVLPRHALEGALKRPSSIPNQVLESLIYLAMIGILVALLPRLAQRSLGALGIAWSGLLAAKQIAAGIGIAIALQIVEPLYIVAIHQTKHRQNGFEHFAPSGTPELVVVGLVLVVLAPIGEELLFRGLIFRALAERMPIVWAALVSGTIFGAVHADLVLFPILATLGFCGALIYARTGNLWSAIAVHATNNGVAFVALTLEATAKH